MRKNILCYGDSNTWGCIPRWKDLGVPSERYSPEVRWTGRLATLLGEGFCVIEEGLGGRTSIYHRPDEPWLNGLPYFKPCLLSHRPLDLVVLMLGTNDLLAFLGPSMEQLGRGIRTLIEVVRDTPKCGRNGAPPPVLVLAPARIKAGLGRTEVYPLFDGPRGELLSQAFPEVYRQVAQETGCWYLDASRYAQPSDADGLHWEEDSHRRLADAVAEKVRELFPAEGAAE